jgi:hypothetical protein
MIRRLEGAYRRNVNGGTVRKFQNSQLEEIFSRVHTPSELLWALPSLHFNGYFDSVSG